MVINEKKINITFALFNVFILLFFLVPTVYADDCENMMNLMISKGILKQIKTDADKTAFLNSCRKEYGEKTTAKINDFIDNNKNASQEEIANTLIKSDFGKKISPKSSGYTYTLLEKIPGFEGVSTNLPEYINAIYKFGLWTIGIAALLMITLGGFMYITSAGNSSSTGKAKKFITDAIAGLILAFIAYLLLKTLNPDLLEMNLQNFK